MKQLVTMLMAVFALTLFSAPKAEAQFVREKFQKTVFVKNGGSASCQGKSYSCAKPIASGDLWAIPAGTLIEKVYVIIDTAITGTTALTVGDDDGAASYVADLASVLATPGMYGWDAKTAGAYLRIQTAGATDAGDIYVVPTAKYYSASGKEIKLANTTTNTAGRMRVVIEGTYHGGPL